MPPPYLSLALAGLLATSSIAVVALTACAGDEPSSGHKGEPPPAPVEVATATAGELVDEWIFVGEIRSLRSAELALGAGGEILMIEAREGDRVEAGELLVEIDKRQASARLSAAVSSRRESERELEQARRQADRAVNLGSEFLPPEEIEQETTRAEALEARKRRLAAEIRAAKAQLSDYLLIAPFAGIIAARHADLGQWLDPGETVLELVGIDEVEILVDVRPELAPHVGVGDQVTLRAAGGLRGAETKALVVGVVPSLDRSTRTLRIRARPIEARTWLLPGAPVDVGFDVRFDASAPGSEHQGAVIVPRDALVLGAVDTRVVLVVDGHAKPIQVEIVATADDQALVRGEGLGAGAVVVTRGNERLQPGQAVRPSDPSRATASEEASK